jgi:hypothetical protein
MAVLFLKPSSKAKEIRDKLLLCNTYSSWKRSCVVRTDPLQAPASG